MDSSSLRTHGSKYSSAVCGIDLDAEDNVGEETST